MRRWLRLGILLLIVSACFAPEAVGDSIQEKTGQVSLNNREDILRTILRDWTKRFTRQGVVPLVGTNVTSDLRIASETDRIRLAESGFLNASILRQIRDLTVYATSASARLFTDSAKQPYGLVSGVGEYVFLRKGFDGNWHIESAIFLHDDYAVSGDNRIKLVIPDIIQRTK
jgi:hypothetical protein